MVVEEGEGGEKGKGELPSVRDPAADGRRRRENRVFPSAGNERALVANGISVQAVRILCSLTTFDAMVVRACLERSIPV